MIVTVEQRQYPPVSGQREGGRSATGAARRQGCYILHFMERG